MSITLAELHKLNSARWAKAKLTRRPEYFTGNYAPVPRIIAARNRYELIQAQTGVHWVFVATTHYRESNLNFSTQLAQGSPLNQKSRIIPYTGPFKTFEEGCYDALVRQSPYAARNKDWSMPFMLTYNEALNGLGYARKSIPSPYVWSGTDQYQRGKYIADGVFDPNTVDKQLGVAGMVMCLLDADPTIKFGSGPVTQGKAVELPVKAGDAIKPKEATPPAPEAKTSPEPPKAVPEPKNSDYPIINKQGEDITHLLEDYLHDVWEWLRKH